MNIITDFLNIPQEDVLSSSSSRAEDGTLIIDVTLVSKQLNCPSCDSTISHIKDYKIKSITHSALNRNHCLIRYHARRFVCIKCGRTFYEANPFLSAGHTISNLTLLNV